jgi:hypothetical protein
VIADFQPSYRLSDNIFRQSKIIIQRSEAAARIESYHEPGSDRPHTQRGISYTIEAVLTCALSLIILGRTPSYKTILNTLGDLSARQLAEVGMAGQDLSRLFGARKDQDCEYHRFERWLTRRLSPLDSQPDQPAHRITNAEHRAIVNSRSPQQLQDYAHAAERLRTVMNKIVAGSIRDPQPRDARGDIVADETIFDLAGPSAGLGARDHLNRGACYFGAYYARDDHAKGPFSENAKGTGKCGFGVGVTVAVRVGPPHKLHAVAPVIVAMDVHPPTSGSPQALGTCIEHMQTNRLDTRPTGKDSYPRVTVDMGYNPKREWVPFLIKHRYSPVVRFPKHWTLTETSTNPPGSSATAPPGPIQFAGSFYCPAAEHLLRGHTVPKTRDLLANGRWAEHDRKLAAVLPFLMGTNSRPIINRRPGRPRLGDEPEMQVKAELVCPAVQLRVRCPLKPASMERAPFGAPLATPAWQADERTCCRQSTLRVTLTQSQLQRATWGGPVVSTWEHALYFEAARSATEQRFSLLKSPHITNLTQLKSGPRREPIVKILLALAIAATNHKIQEHYSARKLREESIDIRMRQLRKHLGYEPTRTPPRT